MTVIKMSLDSFHWILLVIVIEKGRVLVLDSLRKPLSEYQDLINVLQLAWEHFIKQQLGLKDRLEIKTDFLVQTETSHVVVSFLLI